jgi:thiol-disulfide isomerase/thioredoxin
MKNILLLVSAVAVLVSCNKAGDNEYVITGTIKGIKDGTEVFIEKQDSLGQIKAIDTVKIEKEKFTFTGTSKEPEIHLIQVKDLGGKVPIILENGDIEMEINKDSIQNTKVTGTYNNDELTGFRENGMKIQKKMMKFQQANMMKMQTAQQKQDTVTINSLRKEYGKLQEEAMKQSEDYVGSHPKAFISALIIDGMFNQMAPDVEKIKGYYAKLDPSVKDTKPGKNIKKKIEAFDKPMAAAQMPADAGAAIGSIAADFSAKSPEGKTISLKESMGKVTIIDFWASWCRPCREENPKVVALYNELHGKGLNIIGVSLDKENGAQDWKNAIAKDKLVWNQVSNLMWWKDPIAKTYGVESIPATFVLDASGKIVAKDLRGDALKAKVNELLAAK